MRYVRCVKITSGNYRYINITIDKIYECIMVYDNYVSIINDGNDEYDYNKEFFVDVTREFKLKKILCIK